MAFVSALRCEHPGDPQSVALARQLAQDGLPRVLDTVCGLDPTGPLATEIAAAWRGG